MNNRTDDRGEPIALVGIGCRFPGAANPTEFWRMLSRGEDCVTEFPPDRFDTARFYDSRRMVPGKSISKWGAFIDRPTGFDWRHFGISPREATNMDPQHRLLLETAWEALEDAGAPVGALAGSRTGVICALMLNDYRLVTRRDLREIDGYTVPANLPSFASNRISFLLDLRGASLTLDASCASSLVALHVACELIRSGELEGALVGAASLILAPDTFVSLSRASALSPTGRCRTFDTNADGFVRGEGAGVVYLKPLSAALSSGDRIYALILGTAAAHKGADHWIQEPNVDSQMHVIRQALGKAGLTGKDLDYVELHGTGTPRGDPVEAEALGGVVSEGRDEGSRCLVGSVKTNIGHLDPAAGIAGLIKTALAIHRRMLPPSLHFEKCNPAIELDRLHLEVHTRLGPWPRARRTAGVTSIGFGGACAHAVLQAPVARDTETEVNEPGPHILPLSARSLGALRELSGRFSTFLREHGDPRIFDAACYTASVRRSHHTHRLCVVGDHSNTVVEALAAYSRGERHDAALVQEHMATNGDAHAGTPSSNGERAKAYASLASRYCRGEDVDWSKVYSAGSVITLPTYCWQRENLSLEMNARYGSLADLHDSDTNTHPFIHPGVEVADPPGLVWEGRIDLRAHSYLLDHRVGGRSLLPASAFVEVLLWAASRVASQASVELRNIRFRRAIVLSPDAEVRLSVSYRPTSQSDPGGAMRVFSKEGTAWVENVSCDLHVTELRKSPERVDVDRVASQFELAPRIDRSSCYEELAERGLDFGPAFKQIDSAARSERSILARISPNASTEAFVFHPAVQDACMHAMALGFSAQRGAAYLPIGIDVLRLDGSPDGSRLWSRTEIESGPDGSLQSIRGTVDVFDEAGKQLLRAQGIQLARIESSLSPTREALEKWCYEVEWRHTDVKPVREAWRPDGTWIVWLDRDGFGEDLASALSSAGCDVIEACDRPTLATSSGKRVLLSWSDLEDLSAKVQALLDSVHDLRGFVHVGATSETRELTQDSVRADAEAIAACYPPLAIAQSLLRSGLSRAKLWMVTSGVHKTGAPFQGALWGLGRSLVFDLAAHWGGLIDVDDPSDPMALEGVLTAIALQSEKTEEILVRGSTCLRSRLIRCPPSRTATASVRLDPDGRYLVIGGLGGLGLCAAERLVQRGARRLVLVGRSELPDRAVWTANLEGSNNDPRLRRQISALLDFESRGVDTALRYVDVSDPSAFARLLEDLTSDGGPKLRGIVHAAGTYEVMHLQDMTGAAFMRAMRAKYVPLFALEQCPSASDLDFVALFSSAASIINSPRLGHYAAANALLDSFATRLQRKGVRALSLNWGLWSDVGFIERMTSSASPARLHGMRSIPPSVGSDLFEHFLAGEAPQVLVWPTPWEEWASTYPSLTRVQLLSEFVRPDAANPAAASDGSLRERFSRSPPAERESIVRSFLRSELESALQLPIGANEENSSLEDLGFDSLLAAEFATHVRDAFGVEVAALGLLSGATLATATSNVLKTLSTMYPPPAEGYSIADAVDF
jgi:acyl transferase domain-containing protein